MKAYTDLEQSKALAEILPLDSADMCYIKHSSSDNPTWEFNEDFPPMILGNVPINEITAETLPCWSLSALLDVLQIYTTPTAFSTNISVPSLTKIKNGYSITYVGDYRIMESNNNDIESPIEIVASNPIDACYEMILRLHELKMLRL